MIGEGDTNCIAIPHEDEETEVGENSIADPYWPELDTISKLLACSMRTNSFIVPWDPP